MALPRDVIALLQLDTSRLSRHMSFGQRVLFGPMVFDLIVRSLSSDLREEHPHATPEELDRLLIERLNEVEAFEDHRADR